MRGSRSDRGRLPWPASPSAISPSPSLQRCDRRSNSHHNARSCRRRRTNFHSRAQARQPGANHRLLFTSTPRRVVGSDAECAFTVVHRGLSRPKATHEEMACRRVSVASLRRRVRRRRRPGARARWTSDTRSSATGPRLSSSRCFPSESDICRIRERRCAPTPPGPTLPVAGTWLTGDAGAPSTRCCSTAATGAPPTATARPTRCSCRSKRASARRQRNGTADGASAAYRRRRGVSN